MSATIKTGATTWAERSLVQSGWYPPEVKTAEERLRWYASRFPLVENDSGYWAVPDREQTERWVERTPPAFTMNMKAHAILTGHYTDPKRLPKEVRDSLGAADRARRRIYPRHLGDDRVREIERMFKDALEPLHASGKLGVVLFQFPVWFPISRANKAELERIAGAFRPMRVAIEFRNATWTRDDNLDETLSLLAGEGLCYTCVDAPQGFPSSIPPIAAATAETAIVRMHGRNAARWQRGAPTAADRFEYFYSRDELSEWVPKVLDLAERTREVHVLMNNCHSDYAVRNAEQMQTLLEAAAHPDRAVTTPDAAHP